MSTKAKQQSEGDVIVARALSSYAQLRANIASWSDLPRTLDAHDGGAPDPDEELFTADSETAGVGYVAPADGERTKTNTDRLRKQILGKRTARGQTALERVHSGKKQGTPRRSVPRDKNDDEDSEEEDGRADMVRKRKQPSAATIRPKHQVDLNDSRDPNVDDSNNFKNHPNSYLDELLAKRAEKRSKTRKAQD